MVLNGKNGSEQIQKDIDFMVQKAHVALKEMQNFDQEKVDRIVKAMATAGAKASQMLGELAYEETGRGVAKDKGTKNLFATKVICNSIKNDKTVGVIDNDSEKGLTKVAEPLGVLAGITPVTNPTSTTLFKALIAMKTRNAIVFSFHPQAIRSSIKAAQIVKDAAIEAGAPQDAIQWIEHPSIQATDELINNDGIDCTLATGGPGLVQAAYSAGKPAVGVGPGNGPVYIERTANIDQATDDLLLSKTFDNGMICATENSAVVDAPIYDQVKQQLEAKHFYFVPQSEVQQLTDAMFDNQRLSVKGPIAGASAEKIAQMANIDVPEGTKVLAVEMEGIGAKYPMSGEKLSPVISVYKSKDHQNAFDIVDQLLHYGGLGHTAAIQTNDDQVALDFGLVEKATRILVNTPAGLGGVGGIYNNMTPSLTLGTGSWGKNSVSHNVTDYDLLNIKTIAQRRDNTQWMNSTDL